METGIKQVDEFYTVGQVAESLQVSRQTVYRLIGSGQLTAYRICAGSSWRVESKALAAFLKNCRTDQLPNKPK